MASRRSSSRHGTPCRKAAISRLETRPVQGAARRWRGYRLRPDLSTVRHLPRYAERTNSERLNEISVFGLPSGRADRRHVPLRQTVQSPRFRASAPLGALGRERADRKPRTAPSTIPTGRQVEQGPVPLSREDGSLSFLVLNIRLDIRDTCTSRVLKKDPFLNDSEVLPSLLFQNKRCSRRYQEYPNAQEQPRCRLV